MEIEEVRARLLAMIAGAFAMSCGPSLISNDGVEGTSGSSGGGSAGPTGADPGASTSTTSDTNQDADVGATTDVPVFDVGIADIAVDPPRECPPQRDPPIEACDAELPRGSFLRPAAGQR